MMSNKDLEEYVKILSEKPEYVDNLPDEVVNELIDFLTKEISNQEQILMNLQEQNRN